MRKLYHSFIQAVLFFCSSLFFSCGNHEEKPPYLWPETQFAEVLTEVQMAESIIRLGIHRKQDSLILRDSIYNAAFRKMNVKRADFDSNYNYYLNRLDEFDKIYDQVLINLSEQSAMLKEKKKEETLIRPKLEVFKKE